MPQTPQVQTPHPQVSSLKPQASGLDPAHYFLLALYVLVVVDFSIRSPVTCEDTNYVDGEHYRPPVASRLVERLVQVTLGQDPSASDIDRVLLNATEEKGLIEPSPACPEG